MKKHSLAAIVLSLVIVLLAAGCGKPAPTATPVATPTPASVATPTPSPEALKIGYIGSLSGAAAAWGLATTRAEQMAGDKINAGGGIVAGGKRYTLQFIPEDDQYLGPPALAAANILVYQNHVQFIIGPFGATPLLAIEPVTDPNKVIVLTSAISPKVPSPNFPFVFRIMQNCLWQAQISYSYIKNNYPGVTSLAVLSTNDESGQGTAGWEVQGAKQAGITAVAQQYLDRTVTDFSPVLTGVLAQKPDVIDTAAFSAGSVALILKQARELGFKGPVVSPYTTAISDIVNVAGSTAAEDFYTADWDPNSPLMSQQFATVRDEYVSRYGPPFMAIAADWYNAVYIIKAGIEKAGSLDTTKVKEAMESPDFVVPTMSGAFKFGYAQQFGIGHDAVMPQYLTRWKNGKIEMVGIFVPDELKPYMPK